MIMAEAAGQNALICLGFAGFCVLGIGMLGVLDARKTRDMSLSLYERHGLHYVDKYGREDLGMDRIESISGIGPSTNKQRWCAAHMTWSITTATHSCYMTIFVTPPPQSRRSARKPTRCSCQRLVRQLLRPTGFIWRDHNDIRWP